MADFFDKLKESINKGVESATSFTQELLDSTKLNNQLCILEGQKRRALEELGELTYEMVPAGNIEVGKLEEKCAAVKSIADEINSVKESLAQLEKKSQENQPTPPKCSCGAELTEGAVFCQACGKKQ